MYAIRSYYGQVPDRQAKLNWPQALNAVNEDIRRGLPPALAALHEEAAVRAVVICGAGERAFSAGQDLAEGAVV